MEILNKMAICSNSNCIFSKNIWKKIPVAQWKRVGLKKLEVFGGHLLSEDNRGGYRAFPRGC